MHRMQKKTQRDLVNNVVSNDYPATQKLNGCDVRTTHYFNLEPYINDVVLSDKYGARISE